LGIYNLLVNGYFHVLAAFPPALAWVISVALLVGFVVLAWSLIKTNILFVLILALFLPVVIPIIGHVLNDMWLFFLFLLHQVGVKTT